MRNLRCILSLLLLALVGCRETMHSKLSEQDANEMVAVLSVAGINAAKTEGADSTWKLEVEESDFARAVLVLKENGMPRTPYASIGQIFKREGLVSTPTEERIRFIYAQQQELENTLSRLPGVITARVHVVMPQNDPLAEKVKPSSASVVLIHRQGVDLSSSVPQIKALVGHSIEGLSHESVSMSLFASRGQGTADDGRVAAALRAPDRFALVEKGAWLLAGLAVGMMGAFGIPHLLRQFRGRQSVSRSDKGRGVIEELRSKRTRPEGSSSSAAAPISVERSKAGGDARVG